MRENVRNVSRSRAGRERWEFALDGRQVAAVAVGALVIVGSAFVLGMNTGKNMSARRGATNPPASLEAFDTAHANLPAPPEPRNWEYEKLSGSRGTDPAHAVPAAAQARVPPPARPLARPADEAPAVAVAAPPATPSAEAPAAATAPAPVPAPTAVPSAAPPSAMERAIAAVGGEQSPRAGAGAQGGSGYVIQIGASPNRAEADRMARRFASHGARVVAADVDGKRWYRVRLAGTTYDSRYAAEQALQHLARETGVRGFVTAAR